MSYCAHVCAVAKKLKFLDTSYIIKILEDGISFRKIKLSISWSTIYKFHHIQFKILAEKKDIDMLYLGLSI